MQSTDDFKKVSVKWLDSFGETGWCDIDDEITPHKAIHIGFLIKETDEYIVLVRGLGEVGPEGRFVIPKGCVLSVQDLDIVLTGGGG